MAGTGITRGDGLFGTNLRWDTPGPEQAGPDDAELTRRTAVDTALRVEAVATALAAADADPATGVSVNQGARAELQRIVAFSQVQAQALGGVYDPGLPPDEINAQLALGASGVADAGQIASQFAEVPPTELPAAVVAQLLSAAAHNRELCEAAGTGNQARLFASMATAQTVAAFRIAELTGQPSPQREIPMLPLPGPAQLPGEAAQDEEAATAAVPAVPGTEVAPVGLAAEHYQELVVLEDSARYAFEVEAARTDDPELRAYYLERARHHRERAQAWALLGGISETSDDPRHVAYDLSNYTDAATLGLALEDALVQAYATLIGEAAPGTRGALLDLLIDSSLARNSLGAPPEAFPGLPGFGE